MTMTSDSNEIVVMRAMQWEKAKGELRSVGVAFYGGNEFERVQELIEDFIVQIEDEGLLE